MKYALVLIMGILIGGTFASLLLHFGQSHVTRDPENKAADTRKPLYWVAPMDNTYRRDKPGKSPMGMDLIPVFPSHDNNVNSDDTGTITISPHVQQNMGVKLATAKVAHLQTTVNAVGMITYNEDSLSHIHPRVAGWIETLYIKTDGETIAQGQKLYTLYSPQLVNAQEELIIALKRNDRGLAQSAKERLKALHLSSDFIAQLERHQKVSQTVTYYASQDGVVENLSVKEGFYVQPETKILSIAAIDTVWLKANIFEQDMSEIYLGQRFTMTLDSLPEQTIKGTVDFIYPTLDPVTRTLRVRATLANDKKAIKPNMFANVTFYDKSASPVLRIPSQAVIQTQHSRRVVLADEMGNFKSVDVKIGQMGDEFVEITHGLVPGDSIVVSAQFLIDSESSKSSDFKRMQSLEKHQSMMPEKAHPSMHHKNMDHKGMHHD